MGVILRHFQMEPLHVFMTMPEASASLFNLGIYSVAEAARLTGVSTSRIRRWLRGYRFKSRGRRYATDALWHGQLDPIEGKLALGFLDLMEVRFVDAFPKQGISWPTIHKAREKAMAHFQTPRIPSARKNFSRMVADSLSRCRRKRASRPCWISRKIKKSSMPWCARSVEAVQDAVEFEERLLAA